MSFSSSSESNAGWGRWTPIAFLWAAFCLAYMARQSLYSTFGLLRSELGFSEAQLGLTTTVFNWVYGISNALGGSVADRVSKRNVIAGSLVFWSISLVVTSAATSPGMLLAGRSLMGLAQSFYIPAALALIASLHDSGTRSRAITLHGTGQSVGVMAGAYYGAAVSGEVGWRAMLGMLAGFTCVYALVLRFGLRGLVEPAPGGGSKPEAAGPGAGLLRLFSIPTYALVCLCAVAVGANVWMLYTWLPDLLRERFQLPMTQAAVIATTSIEIPMMAGLFAGAFLGDWVSKRWRIGRLYVMVAGLLLACASFYGIAAGGTLFEVRLATGAYAVFKGFYTANYVACVFDLIPAESRGLGVGAINMISAFGGSLSPFLLGALKPYFSTVVAFGLMSAFGVACAMALAVAGYWSFPRSSQGGQRA
ncbi:MAG: MFS transporter [Bryobacterales bacterium]|nr:MFS transporter [Bryobacterales bacterium]